MCCGAVDNIQELRKISYDGSFSLTLTCTYYNMAETLCIYIFL
jgi:hypothetical protein